MVDTGSGENEADMSCKINTIKRKKVQAIPNPFLLYLLFLSTIFHKTSYLIMGSMRLHCVSKNVTPLRMLKIVFHIF